MEGYLGDLIVKELAPVGRACHTLPMRATVLKIVSGGQTGADRAAIDHGVAHAGWCPKGRRAEDGTIPLRYQLQESSRKDWKQRTLFNVRDSDGTVIFTISPKLTRGSKATAVLAEELKKPCLHLCAEVSEEDAAKLLQQFIHKHEIRVLNVAGARASKEPRIGEFVRTVLDKSLCNGTS